MWGKSVPPARADCVARAPWWLALPFLRSVPMPIVLHKHLEILSHHIHPLNVWSHCLVIAVTLQFHIHLDQPLTLGSEVGQSLTLWVRGWTPLI